MDIKGNVTSLKSEIKTLKEKHNITHDITICAATKYVGVKEMKGLLDAGINHFGENRVQDFLHKKEQIQDSNIIWHFIGSLQSNKVKKMINSISYLHSLDRESLAKEINKYRNNILDCFVEVNCSQESTKHGLHPNNVSDFIKNLEKYDKIRVIGLMTMAENTNDEDVIRSNFCFLKRIQQDIINLNLPYAPCRELSMGMSNDYLYAIEEGATIIRIGSRLFR